MEAVNFAKSLYSQVASMMRPATEMEDCMPIAENPIGLKLDQIVLATDFKPTSEAATDYS